jgi:hypothetical protein
MKHKNRQKMKHILGRLDVGLDPSEFDALPSSERDMTPEQGREVFGGTNFLYAPPDALAAARARFARAVQVDAPPPGSSLPPPGSSLPTPATADDGGGGGDYSASASDAVRAFREQGVDPFEDDTVEGDVAESDVSILDDAFDEPHASVYRASKYLETE